ncbi:MAG: hypothetical protein FD135_3620 [Comamonadaceae bacterium]|nr:MAG: hypothetical protein FD135_3620 [Comamonadaceae bacterium]
MKNPANTPRQTGKSSSAKRVTELFHLILENDNISQSTRIWLARLQGPVTQIASSDPLGFSDKNHPARSFISTLAAYASGQGEFGMPGDLLEKEIERLVLLIERFPVADHQVFEWADKELATFIETHRVHPACTDGSPEQQKLQETLTVQYQATLLDKLSTSPAENAVRNFLTQVWAPILAAHAAHKGEEHPDTLKFKHLATELIRINTALLRRRERKQAMGQVPQLVTQLRQGMSWMGLPKQDQDRYIQEIGHNLSDAFLTEHAPAATSLLKTERRSAQRK